jgi:hypothetical protein
VEARGGAVWDLYHDRHRDRWHMERLVGLNRDRDRRPRRPVPGLRAAPAARRAGAARPGVVALLRARGGASRRQSSCSTTVRGSATPRSRRRSRRA